jgi:L-alanine-DL-glutamate epimerase-like enolase superfamily enzyme
LTPQQTQTKLGSGISGVKSTDVHLKGAELFFLPVHTRMPLKFGTETLVSVICARVRIVVADRQGRLVEGWGETPLSVQWVWPCDVSYSSRNQALQDFCRQLAEAWAHFQGYGHPMEIGHDFQQSELPRLLHAYNRDCPPAERMPLLAALVCCSPFDLALHDAYGIANGKPVYETYNSQYMNRDLAQYLAPAKDVDVDFRGMYPADFLVLPHLQRIPVWHLVGGLDPLTLEETNGSMPQDDEPALLGDWIDRDGITCLKVKLRGNDSQWDYNRLVNVSHIAREKGPYWLTADFNCTVIDPDYVNSILDRLRSDEPAIHDAILYVEQPFPYDLEENRIDVHSVSSRKPLLMDESAHHWELVRLGRSLGWTGVALKTCKTQTGALLTLCWAKAHKMQVMVQDLTNPMLAQIPHVLLAAHADTMMGVESNAMQFYPSASSLEAAVHPGLFQRRHGLLDLSSLHGPGFGYRLDEINRPLGTSTAQFGVTDL